MTKDMKILLPETWSDVDVTSEGELLYLGSQNIAELKKHWRQRERELRREIKEKQTARDLPEGRCLSEQKVLDEEIDELLAQKREAGSNVRYLLALEKRAVWKPYLPIHRPADVFPLNAEVVCFFDDSRIALSGRAKKFVRGNVIPGYRHGYGLVSVLTETKLHTDEYCDGKGLIYRSSRPEVMLLEDFNYLPRHLDYLKIWMDSAERTFPDFQRGAMTAALPFMR